MVKCVPIIRQSGFAIYLILQTVAGSIVRLESAVLISISDVRNIIHST